MATELIIRRHCDNCEFTDEEPEASSGVQTIAYGFGKVGYETDLCATCSGAFIESFQSWVMQSRKVAGPKKPGRKLAAVLNHPTKAAVALTGDQIPCPVCDRVEKNRQYLSAHTRKRHNKSLTDLGIALRPRHKSDGRKKTG